MSAADSSESELVMTPEALLTDIAADCLSSLRGGLIDVSITQSLAKLGRFTGAQRVYTLLTTPDGGDVISPHHWQWESKQEAPVSKKPIIEQWGRSMSPLAWRVTDLDDAPRQELQSQGIGWLLVAPLDLGESGDGRLCLEAADYDQSRVETALGLLTHTASILGRALAFKSAAPENDILLRTVIDNLPDLIYVKDTQSRFLINNQAHLRVMGAHRQEDVIGKTDFDVFPSDLAPQYYADEQRVIQTGEPLLNREEPNLGADQQLRWLLTSKMPFSDRQGNIIGMVGISRDISYLKQIETELRHTQAELEDRVRERTAQLEQEIAERKRAEEERTQLQQAIIEAQKRAIQELSTPVIPILDGVIIMPLIGSIDTLRARDIMRSLLGGITRYRARVVILDITGVPIVDSGVASHLDKTVQAARLKGAHTIVTGISEAVGEAIVDLGIDWSDIETLRDLQTGLTTALKRLGFRLQREAKNQTQDNA